MGAVLCGGASRRMGRDKALVEVDGRALAARVADALRAGGCDRVLAVGGDGPALAALGLEPVPDRWPGEGPLGGLASALAAAPPGGIVVLAPCDLLRPSGATVRGLLAALAASADVDGAVAERDGRREWTHAAWRARVPLVSALAELVEGGARRLDAVASVAVVTVATDVDPRTLADADRPEDLPE